MIMVGLQTLTANLAKDAYKSEYLTYLYSIKSRVNTEISNNDIETYLYRLFIENIVPVQYASDFYERTKDDKALGLKCLAIAYHESLNWYMMESKMNENGSYDRGPMALNSKNLENEAFVRAFKPDNSEDMHIYNYYMLICMNYIESLIDDMDGNFYNALKIYNGGWRAIKARKNTSLYRRTTYYADTVFGFYDFYKGAWNEFKTKYHDFAYNNISDIIQQKINSEKEKINQEWVIYEQKVLKEQELVQIALFEEKVNSRVWELTYKPKKIIDNREDYEKRKYFIKLYKPVVVKYHIGKLHLIRHLMVQPIGIAYDMIEAEGDIKYGLFWSCQKIQVCSLV
jgi:hypothetical protein